MPSFGKTIAGLKDLSTALDGVTEKARNSMGVIGQATAAADQMRSSLEQLDAKTEATQGKQSAFLAKIQENTQAISALDTILKAVGDRSNAFSQDIQLQIEAVRIGAQSLEDFLTLYGDAIITLEDGQHRIRDMFSGADFNVYKKQIQDLIQAVQDGSATLGDALAYLQKNAQNLGKGLIEAITAFQRGELSIERLIALLQKYKQDFQGKELGDLADSLLQGLLGGELA